jgi:hypothetical protein
MTGIADYDLGLANLAADRHVEGGFTVAVEGCSSASTTRAVRLVESGFTMDVKGCGSATTTRAVVCIVKVVFTVDVDDCRSIIPVVS